jgi:hypothetical protein
VEQANVRDVRTPDLIDALNVHATPQVRLDRRRADEPAQAWLLIDGLQPHQPEPPLDPLAIDLMPLRPQPGRHPPDAVVRRAGVWFVQQAHEPQIVC